MQQSQQRNSLALRIVLASFPDMRGRAVPPGSFHPCRGFQLVWASYTAAAHFFPLFEKWKSQAGDPRRWRHLQLPPASPLVQPTPQQATSLFFFWVLVSTKLCFFAPNMKSLVNTLSHLPYQTLWKKRLSPVLISLELLHQYKIQKPWYLKLSFCEYKCW